MLTNISRLEVKIEGKVYTLLCDTDSPLAHVKEALFQYQKFVGQIEDNVKANQEQGEKKTDLPVDVCCDQEAKAQ